MHAICECALSNSLVGRNSYFCKRWSCLLVVGFIVSAVLLLYHASTRDRATTVTVKTATWSYNVSDQTMTQTVRPRTSTTKTTMVSRNLSNPKMKSTGLRALLSSVFDAAPPRVLSQQRLPTELEYYSRRQQKVNKYRHKTVLMPSSLCRKNTFMVILVHSSTTNVDHRQAIRVTWGHAVLTGTWPNMSQRKKSTITRLRMAFVLGLHADESVNLAIRQEHARSDDIIQADFIDSCRNLTLKSLFGLKVVQTYCPDVKYLLKSDDDMVINLPYLLNILARNPMTRSFMGPYNSHSRVHRKGVWKLTLEEFPFAVFPPYESGSAYVITGDLINELLATSDYVPHIFLEDVNVTGILGRVLNATRASAGLRLLGKQNTNCVRPDTKDDNLRYSHELAETTHSMGGPKISTVLGLWSKLVHIGFNWHNQLTLYCTVRLHILLESDSKETFTRLHSQARSKVYRR